MSDLFTMIGMMKYEERNSEKVKVESKTIKENPSLNDYNDQIIH